MTLLRHFRGTELSGVVCLTGIKHHGLSLPPLPHPCHSGQRWQCWFQEPLGIKKIYGKLNQLILPLAKKNLTRAQLWSSPEGLHFHTALVGLRMGDFLPPPQISGTVLQSAQRTFQGPVPRSHASSEGFPRLWNRALKTQLPISPGSCRFGGLKRPFWSTASAPVALGGLRLSQTHGLKIHGELGPTCICMHVRMLFTQYVEGALEDHPKWFSMQTNGKNGQETVAKSSCSSSRMKDRN